MKQGICKLCVETKPLLKQSHIIPQFMFKGLFDDTHRTVYDDMRDFLSANKLFS